MILAVLTLCSCAYVLQAKYATIRTEFEQSMKGYNKMLRWRDIENAGMIYMAPEERESFMKTAEAIKKREVTITDYRILSSECTPEKNTAEAVAEFDYYVLPSNRIKTQIYRQNWTYFDSGSKKGWQLTSSLPAFE
jgi:predicted Holliday junction resolvase-like endonuclease